MLFSQNSPSSSRGRLWPGIGSRGAFSLVEVVIAIGVVTVALIGIFALLQSALGTYRAAMNSNIASSIGQQVFAQYLLADFDKMANFPSQTGYYDERGLPLDDSNADLAIYRSVSEVRSDAAMGVTTTNLRLVHITVTSPSQPGFRKDYTSLMARQGKDLP